MWDIFKEDADFYHGTAFACLFILKWKFSHDNFSLFPYTAAIPLVCLPLFLLSLSLSLRLLLPSSISDWMLSIACDALHHDWKQTNFGSNNLSPAKLPTTNSFQFVCSMLHTYFANPFHFNDNKDRQRKRWKGNVARQKCSDIAEAIQSVTQDEYRTSSFIKLHVFCSVLFI